MENSKQNKFSDGDIKFYSDFYADLGHVLLGYKSKPADAPRVIFNQYEKPNIFVRLFRKIFGRFARKSEMVPSSTDFDERDLYSSKGGMS